MDRRHFLTRAIAVGAGAGMSSPGAASARGGILERLLGGVGQNQNTLLDRIDVLLRNANVMFRGVYHGYGLGIKEILAETDGPLPTTPRRTHAGWPHVHCVCHCNVVANLGPESGPEVSNIAGLADEKNQEFFARIFWEGVYPVTWNDFATEVGPGEYHLARQKMKYVMDYTFGDAKTRRRALGLAGMRSRKSSKELRDYRALIYGLVDALESAWQLSDFHDNVLGREGGLKCPRGLSARNKRKWCSGWCSRNGVPTDVAEGPGTARPWGPYHPVYPGPVPTLHDALHGNIRKPFDPKLNTPHPEFTPIERPVLPGMQKPDDSTER